MTTHIKNRIEKILFNGGIVSLELKKLVDILEDIRSNYNEIYKRPSI